MATASIKPINSANRPKEQKRESFPKDRKFLRSNSAVIAAYRARYPVKTAVWLHIDTGAPIRTCEYWLEKDRLPSEAIWALLQTDMGINYLVAGMSAMRPNLPSWFTWLLKLGLTASVLRRRAADRRLLEKTLGADRDLAAAIARTEAALAVSDEDFHRPYVDALRAMGGVPGGAMAPPSDTGSGDS